MSTPSPFRIEAPRGTDLVLIATLDQDASSFTAARFNLRPEWVEPDHAGNDADALCDLTLGAGIAQSGDRELTITVPAEVLAHAAAGTYVASLKLWGTDGKRHLPARGHIQLGPTATATL